VRRFICSRLSVPPGPQRRSPLVAVGLVGLVACGVVGLSQVRIWGEIGWQGQAVAGHVNPLTITVENGTGSVLSATLRVEQRVGSGWRGQSDHQLRAPLLLGPGGQARFVFPWPVEFGSEPLTVFVEADGVEVGRATLPMHPTAGKLVAVVGVPAAPPQAERVVALAPNELPEDPLLLSSFSQVWVAGVPPSVRARNALGAWVAFGGGSVEGVPVPAAVLLLREDELREGARLHRPRQPPVGLVVVSALLYLVAVGYALSALARGRRPWAAGLVILVPLGLALLYPHWAGTPQDMTVVQYELSASDVGRLSSHALVIEAYKGGRWEGPGVWVERVPSGSEVVGRHVEWTWGRDGPRTAVYVEPGKTLVLWRYGPTWDGVGEVIPVVAVGYPVRAGAGFTPLLRAVSPLLERDDRLVLSREEERVGNVAWYTYRLRWERRD